ncbi:MAG: ADP-ribosylglycohydrolase family protein [Microgenomates group bacterium]|jgi:ADP-ribosylglycohydrolase
MISEMLIGVAIGDAFGAGVEMQGRELLKNLPYDRWTNLRTGKYANNYHVGEYSDDTEHTIGLVKALMSGKPFTEDLLLEYWKNEYETDKKRKGYPRQGHGSIESYYKGQCTIEEIRQNQANRAHPGNAPTMRAAPLGLLPDDLLFKYAEINANATHPHKEARDASALVAVTANYILNGGDHANILAYCARIDDFYTIKDTLLAMNRFGSPEEITTDEYSVLCGPQPIKGADGLITGLPCSAIHTALTTAYILKHTDNPFIGLQRSIQIGGDVDSLASATVGILAGRYGLDTIPDFMNREVEGRDNLQKLGQELRLYLNSQT